MSDDYDEVRVLPVYRHMYGGKREKQAPFLHRVEMCRLLFKGIPKVVVSEAERTCFERKASGGMTEEGGREVAAVGTAELLDMLTENEPDVDFALALGADAFVDLADGRWKRSEDVFRMVGHRVVVFRRRKDDDDDRQAERTLREMFVASGDRESRTATDNVSKATAAGVTASADGNDVELVSMIKIVPMPAAVRAYRPPPRVRPMTYRSWGGCSPSTSWGTSDAIACTRSPRTGRGEGRRSRRDAYTPRAEGGCDECYAQCFAGKGGGWIPAMELCVRLA
ncbi:hypothetical protein ACHAW5_004600 [Stephanodiscus triporus]|uniref:Nicotinamide-nucleotide adenylyltransferase n=1 Tax=Stephanodiscus triporus TaxID=2934178 RepID=A0ABD3QU54_9STRA